MTELNVAMPEGLKQWVDIRLAQGRYADAADYVRDLVRRDQENTEDETAWLRGLIDESRTSDIIDAEPEDVIEEIIARYPAVRG